MDVSSRISAAVSHLAAVGSTTAAQPPDRVESPPPPEGAANTQLSRPARLISKLSQLRDSAPDQFKQAVSTIASELRSVSEQDSGMGAKLLVDLANKLDQAANEAERAATRPGAGASLAPGAGEPTTDEASAAGTSSAEAASAPHAPANRAAVDAYRAAAEAHADGAAGPGLARALESVDAAGTGGAERR